MKHTVVFLFHGQKSKSKIIKKKKVQQKIGYKIHLWGHRGLYVIQHQTPLPRGSRLASQNQQTTDLPSLSNATWWISLQLWWYSPPLCCSSDSEPSQSFIEWAPCEALAAHFCWVTASLPALASTQLHQFLVFGEPSPMSLLHVLLPGYCQLPHDLLLCK